MSPARLEGDTNKRSWHSPHMVLFQWLYQGISSTRCPATYRHKAADSETRHSPVPVPGGHVTCDTSHLASGGLFEVCVDELITHPRDEPRSAPDTWGILTLCSLWSLLLTWFNLIPAWISNYIHYKEWDEITYPFLNFNGCTLYWACDYLSMLGLKLNHVSKRGPW